MRTATTVEGSANPGWRAVADYVVEAERIGLDVCWVAEAWGSDAASALGFYAARTERMLLGSVSGRLIRHSRLPVMVVPADAAAS